MAKKASSKWRGSWPAVVTPFFEDGSIDESGFRRNIRLLIDDGVHGIVVAGTTGEYWALDDEERKRLFVAAAEEALGKITVVGGCTSVAVRKVIGFAEHARKVGLDGIMVAPPPGALAKGRELVAHFEAVSDAVDIDIMLYNFAERYGVDMVPTLVDELADIPNIVAIKESCTSFHQQLDTMRLAGDRLAIMAGWPGLRGLPSLVMGADGMIGSIEAQVLGRAPRDMWDAFHAGDIERARAIQWKLTALHYQVTLAVGSAPAQLKAAMNLLGRPGGYPRKPILPLTSEQVSVVRDALERLNAVPLAV
jgi:4-hydroxy-tetrahydrodipicolinate synthase